MGYSFQYEHLSEWRSREEPYVANDFVIFSGNVFRAAFWVAGDIPPDFSDASINSWRLFDEIYDITTESPTKFAKVIAYVPTWRRSENFDYGLGEMYANITHAIIAFLMFSETELGEFTPESLADVSAVLPTVRDTARSYSTRVLIALGGATDYGFLALLGRIGNSLSDSMLCASVQKVVQFVENNALDGVDLDLEAWWDKKGNPVKDQGGQSLQDPKHVAGQGLAKFAQALRAAMPDKLISSAVFSTSWYGNNYPLINVFDWVGIMTYDLTGSWNSSPVGPHASLYKIRDQQKYIDEQHGEWPHANAERPSENPMRDNPVLSVEDSVWYWSNPFFLNWQGEGRKHDRSKLAIGVPIYGYDFAEAKNQIDTRGRNAPPGYKTIRYKEILDSFPDAYQAENGNVKVRGSTTSPSFAGGGSYMFQTNLYFDTPAMAAEKIKFAKRLGLQGVIIWELSNDMWKDHRGIIKEVYRNSGNPKKDLAKFHQLSTNTDTDPANSNDPT